MTEQTTGQQAINLLREARFECAQSGMRASGGTYADMVKGDRRVFVRFDDGDQLREALLLGGWPDMGEAPIATTVEALAGFLAGFGEHVSLDWLCDGWCTGLAHRETCPAHVVPY